jgi:hypothetical protein
MHMPPEVRIPMCDGIRDLIQAYADMQFVAITDDNRGAVARPHQRKENEMNIKRGEIRIGAARREGRAPSHDGEYLSVYYAADGDYIIEGNGGVVSTIYNISDVLADASDPAAEAEIGRWQSEAEAIVAEDAGEDWDAEHMGCEARALAAEFGWL